MTGGTGIPDDEESPASGSGGWRPGVRTQVFLVVLLAVILAILVAAYFWPWILAKMGDSLTLVASLLVSLLFAFVPIVICLVQNTSKSRQLEKLESVKDTPASKTAYFELAKIHIEAVKPVSLGTDYLVPLITFTTVVLVSCIGAFTTYSAKLFLSLPNVILGGLFVSQTNDGNQIFTYQYGTFIVGGVAFTGCYVYTLSRLLDRLTNNDLYPISFYYYTSRFIIAILIACILRHVAGVFGINNSSVLILLGFVTGLAPDLFIIAMARRAFQVIKIFGSKGDPDAKARPKALPLLMIDDLTRDKIDRLNELGIDSAQVLACQNPFMIWPRLPYDLGLIVDWIAEAQLYCLVKEVRLQNLREKLIFDIFDFFTRLRDKDSREEICDAVQIKVASAPALIQQIWEDQSFHRLLEVRDAMLPCGHSRGPFACENRVD